MATIPAKFTPRTRRPSNIAARPPVILARTIKGYGLGEAGEGKNVTHQQKKLNEEELRIFRSRFGIPLNDQDCIEVPFYRPAEDSQEIQYLRARREALGGYAPQRRVRAKPLVADHDELFKEFFDGSDGTRSLHHYGVSSACCAKC